MTEEQQQLANEFGRLKVEASECRARAIRSQIAAGLTFCIVARTELDYGHVEAAHRLLERVQNLCKRVRYHLNAPGHVPSNVVEKVNAELVQLETRVAAIEQQG
jgi:ATP/maltotriose-dependent transcriptional regulator MalT